MAPEIRAKIPRKSYVVHTTFLANQEYSFVHTTFCFFNFTNIIQFLRINFFHEHVQNSLPFHIFKKNQFRQNGAYDYIALDPAKGHISYMNVCSWIIFDQFNFTFLI